MNLNFQNFMNRVMSEVFHKELFIDFTVNTIFFILRLIICFLFYYFSIKLIRKVLPFFEKRRDNILDQSLKSFIKSILNVSLHAILITLCLLILGVKESSLLAFFGTLGIGVGLALKDNLSNFAGGIIILIFKTYIVGDEVNIAGEVGYIYDIDIYSTTVRTHSNDLVIVPNGSIVSGKIINYTKTPLRRLKFVIGISYDSNIDLARKALEDVMKNNPLVMTEPEVYSHVEEYADSSINIALKGWTTNEHYWTVYRETLNEIKGALDKVGVSIPFPQMDIHLNTIEKKS